MFHTLILRGPVSQNLGLHFLGCSRAFHKVSVDQLHTQGGLLSLSHQENENQFSSQGPSDSLEHAHGSASAGPFWPSHLASPVAALDCQQQPTVRTLTAIVSFFLLILFLPSLPPPALLLGFLTVLSAGLND